MELVDTAVNAFVIGGVGFLLYLSNRGLRRDFAEFREEVRQERAENRQEHADIRREIGELRSDLVRVALAVGSEPASPPTQ
jgi:hypothetical protein